MLCFPSGTEKVHMSQHSNAWMDIRLRDPGYEQGLIIWMKEEVFVHGIQCETKKSKKSSEQKEETNIDS